MSTRATVHFHDIWSAEPIERAIIYRHHDGYPEGLGADLQRFFDTVKEQAADTRFNDASYLAAKYVVWQAGQYARDPDRPLSFLSVGVLTEEPGDTQYRYHVRCVVPRPEVTVEKRAPFEDRWQEVSDE